MAKYVDLRGRGKRFMTAAQAAKAPGAWVVVGQVEEGMGDEELYALAVGLDVPPTPIPSLTGRRSVTLPPLVPGEFRPIDGRMTVGDPDFQRVLPPAARKRILSVPSVVDPYARFNSAFFEEYGRPIKAEQESNEVLWKELDIPNKLFRLLPLGRQQGFDAKRLSQLSNEDLNPVIERILNSDPRGLSNFSADRLAEFDLPTTEAFFDHMVRVDPGSDLTADLLRVVHKKEDEAGIKRTEVGDASRWRAAPPLTTILGDDDKKTYEIPGVGALESPAFQRMLQLFRGEVPPMFRSEEQRAILEKAQLEQKPRFSIADAALQREAAADATAPVEEALQRASEEPVDEFGRVPRIAGRMGPLITPSALPAQGGGDGTFGRFDEDDPEGGRGTQGGLTERELDQFIRGDDPLYRYREGEDVRGTQGGLTERELDQFIRGGDPRLLETEEKPPIQKQIQAQIPTERPSHAGDIFEGETPDGRRYRIMPVMIAIRNKETGYVTGHELAWGQPQILGLTAQEEEAKAQWRAGVTGLIDEKPTFAREQVISSAERANLAARAGIALSAAQEARARGDDIEAKRQFDETQRLRAEIQRGQLSLQERQFQFQSARDPASAFVKAQRASAFATPGVVTPTPTGDAAGVTPSTSSGVRQTFVENPRVAARVKNIFRGSGDEFRIPSQQATKRLLPSERAQLASGLQVMGLDPADVAEQTRRLTTTTTPARQATTTRRRRQRGGLF